MEQTDFKNVIFENIHMFQIFNIQPPRLLKNLKNESFPNKTSYSSFWSVEATDFKNVFFIKIHWTASEAANKFEKWKFSE